MRRQLFVWVVLLLIVVAGCTQTAVQGSSQAPDKLRLRGAAVEPPRPIHDFSLSATSGEEFRLSEQRGKVVLLYFGYMSCPDVCPTTFAELTRVYRELGEAADQVTVAFITVDPERDSLDRLTRYMAAFHEDFIGLWAEPQTLQPILDQFGVQVRKVDLPDSALKYTIEHTASVFLIAPDGKLLEQFLYGTPYKDIAEDVRLILSRS